MSRYHVVGEIRVHIEGKNRFEILPFWRASNGTLYIPREKELIFHDGVPYEVTSVEWRYSNGEIASVVVNAGKPTTPPVKLCGEWMNPGETMVINDSEENHYHCCILPETPAEYKHLTRRTEVHLCSCGIWWTVSR